MLTNVSVVVTGGLGFIGSRLTLRLIDAGACVTVVDTMVPNSGATELHRELIGSRARVCDVDVRDQRALSEVVRGADHVVNLAALTSHAESMLQPFEDMSVNVGGPLSLLEACRATAPHARIAHASTRQVYGKPDRLPVDESHPLRPPDVNAVHKVAGENHHELYARVYGIQSTILRFTNVYGPGMRIQDARQNFLGVWIRAMLEKKTIEVWGGEQQRDLLYVDDAVNAIFSVMLSPHTGGTFNVGGSEPVTLAELAQACSALAPGTGQTTVLYPRSRSALEIGSFVTDSGKFQRAFGWMPQTSLKAGLQATFEYYLANGSRYLDQSVKPARRSESATVA